MKTRTLPLIAGALFALSFFLPAYADFTGLRCFALCLDVIRDFPSESPLGWLYYFGLILTNLAFVVILALDVARVAAHKTRLIVSVVAFLHVLSWLSVTLSEGDFRSLQIGYFLWLLAYALLLASQLVAARKPAAAA